MYFLDQLGQNNLSLLWRFFYCVLNSGSLLREIPLHVYACAIATYNVFTPNVYSS